jgi:hypothetical protein
VVIEIIGNRDHRTIGEVRLRLRRFGFYSVKVRIRRRGHFRTVVVPDGGHGVGRSRAVVIRVR